ncbi:hypothetical protein [Paraburkholderia acidisoli]|uniref:Uncharacterized protein n=1 Tax=Paraburkholderia acidisoli TaxID=2571748 RepID=A0A7Z2GNE6_9BURK|nr:hypothetical protein [Paraburkholderia acidisoli]QGZ64594.1 hypothetical protein FAZ98_22390 [Paraburkholderia acidisoli]
MSKYFVAYGSWKLRFSQPTDEQDCALQLFDLPVQLRPEVHSILEDISSIIDTTTGFELLPSGKRIARTGAIVIGNLFCDLIPLAVVELADDDRFVIHHRLTRVDPWIVHMIRVGMPINGEGSLSRALETAYDRDHLLLNNWECFYIKGLPDIELEQKFEIDQNFPYFTLCREWWARVDGRKMDGIVPQLGDEIQYWSYDNHFCEIAENPRGDAGYVSVMQYCKRKNAWHDPLFTFKKKVFNEDALERWERNYENQWLDEGAEAALSKFFDYPLKPLPDWRRTRLDLACEIVETGNLFMVNFDDCRVHGHPDGTGRLQQCEIEYLKTRGQPNEASIYRDFERITQEVEKFMSEMGLTFRRSNYSKLTFLRDHVHAVDRQLADAGNHG